MHHSQIRRAIGLGSLSDELFLRTGVEVAAAAAGVEPGIPGDNNDEWALGPVMVGPSQQAADILTRRHTAKEVRNLASGPSPAVDLLATFAGRP